RRAAQPQPGWAAPLGSGSLPGPTDDVVLYRVPLIVFRRVMQQPARTRGGILRGGRDGTLGPRDSSVVASEASGPGPDEVGLQVVIQELAKGILPRKTPTLQPTPPPCR